MTSFASFVLAISDNVLWIKEVAEGDLDNFFFPFYLLLYDPMDKGRSNI